MRRHRDDDPELAHVVGAIRDVAARLEALTGTAPGDVPDTENRDAGYPYVGREAGGLLFHAARERGSDVFRHTTDSADELVAWVANDLAKDVAMRSCMARYRDTWLGPADSRRLWFPEWSRLAHLLDPAWGARADVEIASILAVSPYRDTPG